MYGFHLGPEQIRINLQIFLLFQISVSDGSLSDIQIFIRQMSDKNNPEPDIRCQISDIKSQISEVLSGICKQHFQSQNKNLYLGPYVSGTRNLYLESG